MIALIFKLITGDSFSFFFLLVKPFFYFDLLISDLLYVAWAALSL